MERRDFLKSLALSLVAASAGLASSVPSGESGKSGKKALAGVDEFLDLEYLKIFELEDFYIDEKYYAQRRKILEGERRRDFKEFDRYNKEAEIALEKNFHELEKLRKTAAKGSRAQDFDEFVKIMRENLHCQIYSSNRQLLDTVFQRELMKIRWQQRFIKLDLLRHWPPEREKLLKGIADGKYGMFKQVYLDYGFRKMYGNQYQDWRFGQKDLEDFYGKQRFIDDPPLERFLFEKVNAPIMQNSDVWMKTPVKVVFSGEINAMAVSTGATFITSEMILRAKTLSEVAGVMGHEIAHVAARHNARNEKFKLLMDMLVENVYTTVLSMLLLTDKISFWTYWWLRFYGQIPANFGKVLLWLRDSRKHEAEADIDGAIYAYKSGYDPRGLVQFFDTVNNEYGDHPGIIRIFFFHPPSVSRMLAVYKTWLLLDKLVGRKDLVVDTPEFHEMQKRLKEKISESNLVDQQIGVWRPDVFYKEPPPGCEVPARK